MFDEKFGANSCCAGLDPILGNAQREGGAARYITGVLTQQVFMSITLNGVETTSEVSPQRANHNVEARHSDPDKHSASQHLPLLFASS